MVLPLLQVPRPPSHWDTSQTHLSKRQRSENFVGTCACLLKDTLKCFALGKDLRDPLDQLLLQMRKPRPSKHRSFGQGCVCVLVSHLQLFVTTWTVARQAPLSMEVSRQEYWNGCHFFLQGIFPTQGWNLGLLHCRQILYHQSHQGSPVKAISLFKMWDQSHICKKLTYGYQGEEWEGINWEIGIDVYTLLYIK